MSALGLSKEPGSPEGSRVICACFPLSRARVPVRLASARCAQCVHLVRSGWRLEYCALGHGMILPPGAGSPRRCDLHRGESA
jgi:hypothetical protein